MFSGLCLSLMLSGCVNGHRAGEVGEPVDLAGLCSASAATLNKQFRTVKRLETNGDLPEGSGVIVHTIHGPGARPDELDFNKLNVIAVDADKTCGTLMDENIYLPWCGANRMNAQHQWEDFSSWSYLRRDTLRQGSSIQHPDEVYCSDTDNKKYGLIFDNSFMNQNDNLGCMYPIDGGTDTRAQKGCGKSFNPKIVTVNAQAMCPIDMTAHSYEKDWDHLLTGAGDAYASYAGDLICSLQKPQFDLWVDLRKTLDLSKSGSSVNEFVLFNWNTYSTINLASGGYLTGIYYLTGCSQATDGNQQDAAAIADLYKKWSGVDVPVINLSNAAMRQKGSTPFSCD